MSTTPNTTPPPQDELKVPNAPRARYRFGRFSRLNDGDIDDNASVISTQSAPATSSSPARLHAVTGKGSPLAARAFLHPTGDFPIDDDATTSETTDKQPATHSAQKPAEVSSAEDLERMNFHKQALRYLQWHAPASAGLFVGNLPNQISDRQLNDWLSAYFNGFGPCAVEVQRKISMHNGTSMAKPHAIIQFAVSHSLTS